MGGGGTPATTDADGRCTSRRRAGRQARRQRDRQGRPARRSGPSTSLPTASEDVDLTSRTARSCHRAPREQAAHRVPGALTPPSGERRSRWSDPHGSAKITRLKRTLAHRARPADGPGRARRGAAEARAGCRSGRRAGGEGELRHSLTSIPPVNLPSEIVPLRVGLHFFIDVLDVGCFDSGFPRSEHTSRRSNSHVLSHTDVWSVVARSCCRACLPRERRNCSSDAAATRLSRKQPGGGHRTV